MKRNVVIVSIVALYASVATADVRLAAPFGSHMVLQRGLPVPVWGWAEPGEKVTVEFAGQKQSIAAGKDGKWRVRLEPLGLSKQPREMTVFGKNKIVLGDVLVGDVWVCSGQSNMGRDVARSWRPDDMPLEHQLIRWTGSSSPAPYPVEDVPGRDWTVVSADTIGKCVAVGFFFAQRVQEDVDVPIGLLWCASPGTFVAEWMPRQAFRLAPELEKQADEIDAWYPNTPVGREVWKQKIAEFHQWLEKAEGTLTSGEPFPLPQPMMPEPPANRGPTFFYNRTIHPLLPYAIKGVIWYQGESDKKNRQYAIMQKAMIQSWRKLFTCAEDSPFYYVQLQRGSSGDWCDAIVRDEQLRALKTTPHSGMAVLLDLDVETHPQNKYDAGRRLALWALAKDYGKKIPFSGPLYKSHSVQGNKMVLEFDYTEGGLFLGRKDGLKPVEKLADGKLQCIEIAGKDRRFQKAESRIVGEKLEVWSDKVPNPVAVRYAYEVNFPEPFLYNAAGLPSPQFRTDDW